MHAEKSAAKLVFLLLRDPARAAYARPGLLAHLPGAPGDLELCVLELLAPDPAVRDRVLAPFDTVLLLAEAGVRTAHEEAARRDGGPDVARRAPAVYLAIAGDARWRETHVWFRPSPSTGANQDRHLAASAGQRALRRRSRRGGTGTAVILWRHSDPWARARPGPRRLAGFVVGPRSRMSFSFTTGLR